MGIKFWLEGMGPKPTWAGDDQETGAAIRVDRALAARVRGLVTKALSCLHKPSTTDEKQAA